MSARFILAILIVSASVIPDQLYATGPTRNKQIAACKVSTDAYHATGGRCACPYDRALDGSPCGKRSAFCWSVAAKPCCYYEVQTSEEKQQRRHGLCDG
jgi:hypothetical protein